MSPNSPHTTTPRKPERRTPVARTTERSAPTLRKPERTQQRSILPLVIMAVAVALLLWFAVSRISSCSHTEEPVEEVATVSVPAMHGAFDWQNLGRSNGRFTYSIDGEVVSKFGIDVSENNGEIDWQAVAADGVEFAFVRVGYRGNEEGGIHLDVCFEEYLAEARAAGIPCGVYFFSQAITPEEAREEARFCITQLKGSALEYPIAFDSETHPEQELRNDNIPRGQMSLIAQAFCEEVKSAGYEPLIYGSSNDLARYVLDDLKDYPFWYAEYGSIPTIDTGFTIWQCSHEGTIAGIKTAVDTNIDLSAAVNAIAQAGGESSSSSSSAGAEADGSEAGAEDGQAAS